MSGRDHEPVSAFFPSIDRNLIRDLDRHLRGAQNEAESPAPVPTPPDMQPAETPTRAGLRPDVAHAVEAIEYAGQSMAEMNGRIDQLEGHIGQLEDANAKLAERLSLSQQQTADLEARLQAEKERAGRIEAVAAQQAARAAALDRELNAAHGDLARITDTIAATLGHPRHG